MGAVDLEKLSSVYLKFGTLWQNLLTVQLINAAYDLQQVFKPKEKHSEHRLYD